MALAMYEEPVFALPHPPISLSLFLVIEEAICAAWQVLRLRPPAGFVLATAVEVQITTFLHQILKDEIWNRGVVKGFDDEGPNNPVVLVILQLKFLQVMNQ